MSRTTAETSAMLDDLLSTLNPEQRTAALHGDDPLLIVAGAGTGKTTTLAHRVAALIARGVDPKRILLLTFTRRSAAEMLRRVDSILVRQQRISQRAGIMSGSASRDVCGGTFHAVATRLLRQHGKLIGLEPEFTVIDRSDAEDLLNVLRAELELAKADKRFPLKGTCLDVYSRVVSTQLPLEQVLKESFPWVAEQAEGLKRLFTAYSERKEQQQTLDYDDLLLFWHYLMTEPACGDVVRRKFDCVMVDEYQDTNTLQAEIVKGLSPDGRGLTVVGDDAQSIYSFARGDRAKYPGFSRSLPRYHGTAAGTELSIDAADSRSHQSRDCARGRRSPEDAVVQTGRWRQTGSRPLSRREWSRPTTSSSRFLHCVRRVSN